MKPFIFTERNGIHIIDLQQTVTRLSDAMNFIRELAATGKTVLFVGTKKQAQETIEHEAARAGMPFVNQRWMGGMLTNFRTIQTRIKRLNDLKAQKERGDFERLPKKEAAALDEEIQKLTKLLGGMENLGRLPDAVFVVDPHREALAVGEARRLALPLVAMVDTNCNPDVIDYPVPANDDAIRAIRLLTSKIADAVLEGAQQRESELAKAEADAAAEAEEAEIAEELEPGEEVKPEVEVSIEEMSTPHAAPEEEFEVEPEVSGPAEEPNEEPSEEE